MKTSKNGEACKCCGRGKLRRPRKPLERLQTRIRCDVCGWNPDEALTSDLVVPSLFADTPRGYVGGYRAGMMKSVQCIADLFGERFKDYLRSMLK